MKKLFAILACISIISLQYSCSQNENQVKQNTLKQEQSKTIAKNLDAKQFYEMMQTSPGIILDVRTPGEYAQGHMPEALNMDIHDANFKTNLQQLNKDTIIYVYCASGSRSSQAMSIMEKDGFTTIYNYKGYFSDWVNKGYPVIK